MDVARPFNDEPITLKARLVFPVSGPPIENGCVEVSNGIISAVHHAPPKNAQDLGNVALLPRLVNAHTHLEFSLLSEALGPAIPFTEWIRSVMGYRGSRHEPLSQALVSGMTQTEQAGTGAVGEIATYDVAQFPNTASESEIISFRELIGFGHDRITEALDTANRHIADCRRIGIQPGLSPHAPYSVHPQLLRQTVDLAIQEHVPIAMHLAETEAEIEFIACGSGQFVTFLEELGIWKTGRVEHLTSVLDYLNELARAPHSLAVHCNYLTEQEVQFLADNQHVHVVYCPRTHAYFKQPPHAWQELVARGVSLAIGTDGRCSNPDLDMWREARFLWQLRKTLAPSRIVELVTLCGARALGVEESLGSIDVGKSAKFAVVDLSGVTHNGSSDPYDCLFSSASCSPLIS